MVDLNVVFRTASEVLRDLPEGFRWRLCVGPAGESDHAVQVQVRVSGAEQKWQWTWTAVGILNALAGGEAGVVIAVRDGLRVLRRRIADDMAVAPAAEEWS